MNYIDEFFLRADIQQMREFLLNGVEVTCIDPRPYKQRLESVLNPLIERLHTDYPDKNKFEEMAELVFLYAGAVEEVYMEIGLQVGAILSAQVGQNLKRALEKE
nr:hypothetical protein [uncultured Solibaculum sp.]